MYELSKDDFISPYLYYLYINMCRKYPDNNLSQKENDELLAYELEMMKNAKNMLVNDEMKYFLVDNIFKFYPKFPKREPLRTSLYYLSIYKKKDIIYMNEYEYILNMFDKIGIKIKNRCKKLVKLGLENKLNNDVIEIILEFSHL